MKLPHCNSKRRIKVRIKGLDDKISDENLVFCDPFLPKYLNIIPKVGEAVKIQHWRTDKTQTRREYIGPVVSQVQRLNNDPLFFTAFANTEYGQTDPLTAISKIPE